MNPTSLTSLKQSLRTLLGFILISLHVSALAQADKAGPILADYTADKVSPSTYVIHGPLASPNPENQGFMNNPAFIIGDGGIIVIDAGGTVQSGEMVLDLIEPISDLPVVATFSTHIHGDHWLGNQAIAEAYPDAKHYAHPKLIEQAIGGEGQSWVDTMNTLTEGASAGTVFLTPDTLANDSDQFTIAGITISVYHDELAHTDTDITLRFDEENVVFMGDTTMNGRLGRLDDGNFKGLITFLDRMLALEGAVYVPGHGETGASEVVTAYKEMMELIYNTVETEYENGLADFEIKPLVEAQISDKSIWTDLEASLGRFISLAYLEVEEDSF